MKRSASFAEMSTIETPDATEIVRFVYDRLLSDGVPPAPGVIGANFGLSEEHARTRLRALSVGKTVLVRPGGDIWMAGPFSAVETAYRVIGSRVRWWANCAWDMFGIAIIAGEEVLIETRCTDCGDPWQLRASPSSPPHAKGVVHFLLPARDWYKDIGFT